MKSTSERIRALRLEPEEIAEPEPSGRARWWVAGAVAVLALVALALWSLRTPEVLTVETVAVAGPGVGGRAGSVLEGSGHVVARRQATVSATLTGRLVEILPQEGATVEEGQLLARLDDSNLQALLGLDRAQLSAARQALAETEVRLAEARLELERTRNLFDEKIVSRSALDAAEASVRSFDARLAQGRELAQVAEKRVTVRLEEIEDTRIRAPFSGVVVSQNAQLGEMVSPVSAGGGFTRTGIFTLVDMDSLEAAVHVSENYISRIRRGMPARVILDAHPDLDIDAEVLAIVPAADVLKATFRVRLAFLDEDPRILPNMRVKVTFLDQVVDDESAQSAPRGSTVPSGAVVDDESGTAVYVIRDGRLARRSVAIGSRTGDRTVILSGLSTGERVVFPLPPGAADGRRAEESEAP